MSSVGQKTQNEKIYKKQSNLDQIDKSKELCTMLLLQGLTANWSVGWGFTAFFRISNLCGEKLVRFQSKSCLTQFPIETITTMYLKSSQTTKFLEIYWKQFETWKSWPGLLNKLNAQCTMRVPPSAAVSQSLSQRWQKQSSFGFGLVTLQAWVSAFSSELVQTIYCKVCSLRLHLYGLITGFIAGKCAPSPILGDWLGNSCKAS